MQSQIKFRISAVALGVLTAFGCGQVMAEELVGTNTSVRIYGTDTGSVEVTGVSVEPFQGKPFTIIYAQDNSAAPITNIGATNGAASGDVASIVVYDAGGAAKNSSNTYVKLQAGSGSSLEVSGAGITALGGIDNSSGGITNAGAISGATTINASGLITGTGGATISGTTSINSAGTSGTQIGGSGTSAVTVTSGTSSIATTNSGNTITGTTNIITGVTSSLTGTITSTVTGGTSSATLNNSGVTITGVANSITATTGNNNITANATTGTNNIEAWTNNIGVATANSINNIGTNSAYSSTNTFGSTNTGTTVNQYGGNSSMSLANGTASLTSGGNGFTSTSAAQVVGTDITLSNGNSASRQLVNGADVVNVIRGNTLVDGNMYINGSLTYSSSSAATTTVTDSSRNTWGGMSVVNAGQTGGVSADANGKLTTGSTATQATAALTVTNTLGNTHGIVVQEDKTTISGGTRSSSLTMDDNGATFSNSATGAPVQVHGVKDGTADYDAVNVRQFSSAIASVTAMANIPQVDQNKIVAVGVAMGSFMGKSALAAGISYRFTKNGVLKGSVSTAMNSSESTAVGIGAAWSY